MERNGAPPVFQIDLSLPPAERYQALARKYQTQLRGLTQLFDQILEDIALRPYLFPWAHRLARIFRIRDAEERAELQGISRVIGVPMYLLTTYNVLLDVLMGCTSGAARSREAGQTMEDSRMLHFRTLDWDMDPLREVVAQLEFVRTASPTPKRVIATSLTYVGYVGVLTGVREGMSLSLNFRPRHNANTFRDDVRFYGHLLLVLTGFRRSISSLLRYYLLSAHEKAPEKTLDDLAQTVAADKTTACYLTLCDGNSTVTIEKDLKTGVIQKSNSFIVITNHDVGSEEADQKTSALGARMSQIIEESVDRRGCISKKWERKCRRAKTQTLQKPSTASNASNGSVLSNRRSTRSTRSNDSSRPSNPASLTADTSVGDQNVSVTKAELIRWVEAWPTTNECTHFSAIMDPKNGTVAWARRFPMPTEAPPSNHRRQSYSDDTH